MSSEKKRLGITNNASVCGILFISQFIALKCTLLSLTCCLNYLARNHDMDRYR